ALGRDADAELEERDAEHTVRGERCEQDVRAPTGAREPEEAEQNRWQRERRNRKGRIAEQLEGLRLRVHTDKFHDGGPPSACSSVAGSTSSSSRSTPAATSAWIASDVLRTSSAT